MLDRLTNCKPAVSRTFIPPLIYNYEQVCSQEAGLKCKFSLTLDLLLNIYQLKKYCATVYINSIGGLIEQLAENSLVLEILCFKFNLYIL